MRVTLKNVRLSFPDLFEPRDFQGDGKFRYNATFLVAPGSDNDKAVRAAIKQVAKDAFGAKADKLLASFEGNPQKFAYLSGDLKDYDGYEGMMYLACHTKTKPAVFDRDRSELTASDGRPYAGCYVNAIVDIYAQANTNPGIRASVVGVMFWKDGDAFGAGAPATAEDFDDLGMEDEDALA